jgi:hypothetical protein
VFEKSFQIVGEASREQSLNKTQQLKIELGTLSACNNIYPAAELDFSNIL